MERGGMAHPAGGAARARAWRTPHTRLGRFRAVVPATFGGREHVAVSPRGARDSRVRRLLFVGTNRGPGGTESHLVSLAIAMADAGYDVAAVVRAGDVIARALA